jgi:cytochrome c peroxidase
MRIRFVHQLKLHRSLKVLSAAIAVSLLSFFTSAQTGSTITPRPQPFDSLKKVPVPEPANLGEFVKDKKAAIALGKALFWDMQVGSSGKMACASCHFHAGADNRFKNSVNPGVLGRDTTFQLPGPNGTLNAGHFPLTKFLRPDQPGAELDRHNILLRNVNDRVSSQGVRLAKFIDVIPGSAVERTAPLVDPQFSVGGRNVARVDARNAPTVINAVFNYSNFHDGRARNVFNGVTPFGELDEDSRVFLNENGKLKAVQVRIPDSSLASQAMGPPVSDFEMSAVGRTFPKIGKKMLSLKPLAAQRVHPQDGVLGIWAESSRRAGAKGLRVSYVDMIRFAFHERWWSNSTEIVKFVITDDQFHRADATDPRSFVIGNGTPSILRGGASPPRTDEYTQMEANFSLFFGLAVQLYEATLVSDDSKFDQVMEQRAVFTEDELAGMNIFMNQGRCMNCHQPPEFTNHSVRNLRQGEPHELFGGPARNAIEFMNIANRGNVVYDNGFYNIAVRPAGSNIPGAPGYVPNNEDIGRGNLVPILNPLTGSLYPLSYVRLAKLKASGLLPEPVAIHVPDLPAGLPADIDESADGLMKSPGIRNSELTGPYFHNGDSATLQQVVELYVRGGNFPKTNAFNLDLDIRPLGHLAGRPDRQKQLVAFMNTLTDERVRLEQAPFDHPQLLVPNGSPGDERHLACRPVPLMPLRGGGGAGDCESFIEIREVGARGRPASNLPPLQPFLNLDPMSN